MSVFQPFYRMKLKTSLSLKCWHFEASEDIMTKFKLQAFHIIRIKYWKASGGGNPPSLIPALRNIGILLHKQVTHTKHSWGGVYLVREIKPPILFSPIFFTNFCMFEQLKKKTNFHWSNLNFQCSNLFCMRNLQ